MPTFFMWWFNSSFSFKNRQKKIEWLSSLTGIIAYGVFRQSFFGFAYDCKEYPRSFTETNLLREIWRHSRWDAPSQSVFFPYTRVKNRTLTACLRDPNLSPRGPTLIGISLKLWQQATSLSLVFLLRKSLLKDIVHWLKNTLFFCFGQI